MTNSDLIVKADEWLELQLETTDKFDVELLENALFTAGALSVTLTSKFDEIMLLEPTPGELPLWDKGIIVTGLYDKATDFSETIQIIKGFLDCDDIPLLNSQSFADKVWELEWSKYFKPLQFGDNLWICPSTQQIAQNLITDKTRVITLDPGLAFGTGTHPTTAMVLEYLAQGCNEDYVIDYGCGSGILGIAALKMGAKLCLMTDIDNKALETTVENATLNNVVDKIVIKLPEQIDNSQKTSLLIANILYNPLLELKDTFASLCVDNATIILTGLLNEQTDNIVAHYSGEFDNFVVTNKGDWAMVTANYRGK